MLVVMSILVGILIAIVVGLVLWVLYMDKLNKKIEKYNRDLDMINTRVKELEQDLFEEYNNNDTYIGH